MVYECEHRVCFPESMTLSAAGRPSQQLAVSADRAMGTKPNLNQGCTQLHAASASPCRHVSSLLEPCVQTFFVVLIPSSTWLVPRLCDQLKDWSDMNLPSAGATKPPVLFNCNRWCTYKFELVLSKKPVPLEVFVFCSFFCKKVELQLQKYS